MISLYEKFTKVLFKIFYYKKKSTLLFKKKKKDSHFNLKNEKNILLLTRYLIEDQDQEYVQINFNK